jgi:two-component system cell cycle response regulator
MAKPKKILVVDDEPDMVVYLSTFLSDEGFDVTTAYDGPHALDLAKAERPDLITLDITMPGMSGIEVLTALRRDPDLTGIPVIIITGVTGFRELTDHRGVRHPEEFLSKPVDLAALTVALDRLIQAA